MKCPHCTIAVHPAFGGTIVTDGHGLFRAKNSADIMCSWYVNSMTCPACYRAILSLREVAVGSNSDTTRLILPKSAGRAKAPITVPAEIAEDFNESCLVITDSPKASAALSRRCLQGVLREQGFIQHDLAPAIQAILASKVLPGALASSLDAVRNIGNFAAHPMKDKASGSILPVEPEEAEWNLDVLEELFDFFYVQPALANAKIAALNAKLATAGKPPIK